MNMLIESVSVVDAIEERIKEMIASGTLKPGQQLPSERNLQAQLGVSRLPLREALARLQALGLIRIRHGKGAFVEESVSPTALSDVLITFFPHSSTDKLRDLVEARSLLEGEISALASQKATDENLGELEAFMTSSADAAIDPEKFADLDYSFHHQLATLAGNSFLLLMHEALGPHIRSFLKAYAVTEADRIKAHERNLALLGSVKSRDAMTAAKTAREHLVPCLKSMTRIIAGEKAGA